MSTSEQARKDAEADALCRCGHTRLRHGPRGKHRCYQCDLETRAYHISRKYACSAFPGLRGDK
jgi:hypothetical protein